MKTVVSFLIFLAFCHFTPALIPAQTHSPREVVTVDFLYESCGVVGRTAKGQIPFFDCESYVYGVLDSYLAVRSSLPQNERACFPASIAPWKVLEDARALGIVDSEGSQIAAPELIEAMRKKYPCKR